MRTPRRVRACNTIGHQIPNFVPGTPGVAAKRKRCPNISFFLDSTERFQKACPPARDPRGKYRWLLTDRWLPDGVLNFPRATFTPPSRRDRHVHVVELERRARSVAAAVLEDHLRSISPGPPRMLSGPRRLDPRHIPIGIHSFIKYFSYCS